MRDTAVGWTTRARRTPHTGRGQPWAARGGFREAVRARQGLARVASVGRISVQVGLRTDRILEDLDRRLRGLIKTEEFFQDLEGCGASPGLSRRSDSDGEVRIRIVSKVRF